MNKFGKPVRIGATAVGLLAIGGIISACGSSSSPTPAVTVTATVTQAAEPAASPIPAAPEHGDFPPTGGE